MISLLSMDRRPSSRAIRERAFSGKWLDAGSSEIDSTRPFPLNPSLPRSSGVSLSSTVNQTRHGVSVNKYQTCSQIDCFEWRVNQTGFWIGLLIRMLVRGFVSITTLSAKRKVLLGRLATRFEPSGIGNDGSSTLLPSSKTFIRQKSGIDMAVVKSSPTREIRRGKGNQYPNHGGSDEGKAGGMSNRTKCDFVTLRSEK